MIFSAASTIDLIFKVSFVLDIIIGAYLFISTCLGCAKGFWRGTFRFLFVVLMLVISWFFLVDTVALYIRDDLFNSLDIIEKVNGVEVKSFGALIEGLITTAPDQATIPAKFFDPIYMEGFILALCKTLAWVILVFLVQFVSWIISSIIYFLLIRMIIPKRIRSVKLRLLGGFVGLLQGVLIAFALMIPLSALAPAVKGIEDPGKGSYRWFNDYVVSLISGFDPNNSKMLEPYIDSVGEEFAEDLFEFKVGEETYIFGKELFEFFQLTSTFEKDQQVEQI